MRGVDDAYAEVFALGDAVSAGEWRVPLGGLERPGPRPFIGVMLGNRSLGRADVTLYPVRRGLLSSLPPLANYPRRTEPALAFLHIPPPPRTYSFSIDPLSVTKKK